MSVSPYIIICDSEVGIALANSSIAPALQEQIKAASAAAKNLAIFLGSDLTIEDADRMSNVLHWFEDEADGASKEAISAHVTALINICKDIGGVTE